MPAGRLPVTYPPDFRQSVWSLRRATSDPLKFLEELARFPEDVVPFSLAGRPACLLKHPDLVETVLVTDHHNFVKSYGLERARRLLGNGLLTAEGPDHRRQRGVVQPAFHRQHMERYADIMVDQAVRFRDRWRPGPSLDISSEASALTLAITARALFGADVDALSAEVRHALRAASDAIDPLVSLLAPVRRVRPQRARLARIVDDLIVSHRSTGRDSLISLLLAGQDGGSQAVSDQVRDDALTILLAGHDTIANALVWTWILLARHPAVEAGVEREVDAVLGQRPPKAADVPALAFTRRVLAESLRLRPPAWVVARTAKTDCELGGVGVPAGSIVLVSQYLLHRDRRYFSDPDVFDPDRWLDDGPAPRPRMAYIPFGAGPRACIGEGFAWVEGVLLLATFAQRWRFRLAEHDDVVPQPKITLRPPPTLAVTLEERRARG